MKKLKSVLFIVIALFCLLQPSKALDIGQFVQLFVIGPHAAIRFNGGTSLVDNFSNDMRVDGDKFFINYWFNSVSQSGSFYLSSDSDRNGNAYGIIQFDHNPGTAWNVSIVVNCIPQIGGAQCDRTRTNSATLYFEGPTLPNDAPCNCWHHLMVSINTSIPGGTYA